MVPRAAPLRLWAGWCGSSALRAYAVSDLVGPSPHRGPASAPALTDLVPPSDLSDQEAARLAATDPSRLASWLASGELDSVDASCAAEILGRDCADSALVVPALLRTLRHDRAIVREGAVYGLRFHRGDIRVLEALQKTADDDASSGVRLAAREVLDAP